MKKNIAYIILIAASWFFGSPAQAGTLDSLQLKARVGYNIGLADILQQVFASFEADAETDGRVGDRHRRTLFGSEETEDGRGGMDGQ